MVGDFEARYCQEPELEAEVEEVETHAEESAGSLWYCYELEAAADMEV